MMDHSNDLRFGPKYLKDCLKTCIKPVLSNFVLLQEWDLSKTSPHLICGGEKTDQPATVE